MQVGQLTVNLRNTSGKGPARKLRARGLVPGVFYGASTDGPIAPFQITVDVKSLKASLDPVRRQNTVITVTVLDGDKQVRTLAALLKEYQLDPVRRDVTHVDLLAIDPNKEVVASVPLEFIGKPKGFVDGGVLHTVMRSVQVKAKPSDIPVKLTLDVSGLDIGDVLHVSDISLAEGVISVTGGREAVISLVPPDRDEPVAAAAATPDAAAPAKDAKGAPAKGAGKGDAKAAKGDGKAAPAKAAAKSPAKK